MVSQVWLRLRATAKKIPSSHRNKVAFRRSVYQNEWSPALLVASHGPERSRHRYSGPTEARPLGNFALLSLATLYDRESSAHHHAAAKRGYLKKGKFMYGKDRSRLQNALLITGQA